VSDLDSVETEVNCSCRTFFKNIVMCLFIYLFSETGLDQSKHWKFGISLILLAVD